MGCFLCPKGPPLLQASLAHSGMHKTVPWSPTAQNLRGGGALPFPCHVTLGTYVMADMKMIDRIPVKYLNSTQYKVNTPCMLAAVIRIIIQACSELSPSFQPLALICTWHWLHSAFSYYLPSSTVDILSQLGHKFLKGKDYSLGAFLSRRCWEGS